MGIKLAKALGNKVVAISTSNKKEALAKSKGADAFVVSKDPESIKKHAMNCDIILDTVSAPHDVNLYWPLLNKKGVFVCIGGNTNPQTISLVPFMYFRQSLTGSIIGGIRETQEVVDLCHKHNIYPDCEVIEADKIDWAWDQLTGPTGNADGIRYVIDIKKSLENKNFIPKE